MDQNQEQPKQQIEVDIPLEKAVGEFCNLFFTQFGSDHFVFDFVALMPAMPKAQVRSRIIVTPEHAKRIIAALSENMKKFEETFGEVHKTEGMGLMPSMGGPTAQA